MRLCKLTSVFYTPWILLLIGLLAANLAHASIEGVKQASFPEPFFAQYRAVNYSPSEPPISNEEFERQVKKLTRQQMAKGVPEKRAEGVARQLAGVLKEPSGGRQVSLHHIAASGSSKLWGGYAESNLALKWWPKGFLPSFTLEADRQLHLLSVVEKNGRYYPSLSVKSVDVKRSLPGGLYPEEVIIFGFEPLESLFKGKPRVTRRTDGETVLEFVSTVESYRKRYQKVILDREGRITYIFDLYRDPVNHSDDTWTASDFVKANDGWIPGTITRRCHQQGKVWTTKDCKLIKLETGSKVIDRWFSHKVDQPTFVRDSRYHGVIVRYFTKDKLLSDEEVKRRAKAIAGQNRPLRFPGSPWKTAGILLILLGAVLLIRKLGWPRKSK